MRRIRTLVVAVLLAGSAYGVVRGSMTDVLTGAWTPAGLFADARTGGAAVSLPDGRTLIAGGNTAEGAPTDAVVVYDPIAASFTTVGHLVSVHVGHTATLLDDGRVLVVGGTTDGLVNADLELFDSSSGMSSLVAVMGQPRSGHAAARLADGTVLIVGGSTTDGVVLQSAEIFDPTTNGLTLLTSGLVQKRTGASATTLIDGRVLVAGGNDGTADLGSAEIYYPLAQTFSPVPTQLSVPRAGHVALLLPHNNGVLIAGGTSAGQAVTTADLFLPAIFPDPFSYGVGEFVPTGAMAAARSRAIGGAAGGDGLAFAAGGGVADAEHYHFATIKTDKDDYAPGERAVITGAGWQSGEEVTLLFQEDPAVHADYVLTVVADSEGKIFWDQWAPEEHDLGVRFYLTATDSVSRAQTTFTDGNLQNVTIAPPTAVAIQPGNSAAYTVNVNIVGNSDPCTVTLSVTTSLPAGATASFSLPNPTTTNADFSRTLTIATTAATPAGSYPFTVQATRGANCQGSGNLTTTGTLIVGSSYSINDRTLAEGNSGTTIMSFTVSKSIIGAASSVQFSTANESATGGAACTAGVDYISRPLTALNFTAAQSSLPVSVTICGDTTPEPNEDFFVNLTSPSTGMAISDSQGVGTINNDDVATATLKVKKVVMNDHGGTAVAGNWTLAVSSTDGGTGTGSAPGSTTGTDYTVQAGKTYNVTESGGPAGYAESKSADCTSLVPLAGNSYECTITNNDIQPKLFVIKNVTNDHGGTATSSSFTMSVTGTDVSPAGFPGEGTPGTEVGLDAGPFSVGETGPAGYARSDAGSCSGMIAIGETKTCTITNDDIQPKLTVIKIVTNDHGGTATPASFTMTVNGTDVSPASFSGASAPGTEVGLDAGSFSVAETGPSGYARSDAGACTGMIAIGETKTCTITNDDIQPKLTVIKDVINDNGGTATPANFTMTVNGTDVSPASFAGASGSGTEVGLDAGPFSVDETGPAGYARSDAGACTGMIAIGETKTCTITNDDIQPKLFVIKTVTNDHGGTAAASDFTMSVTGIDVSPETFPGAVAPGTEVGLDAGSYSVNETGPAGYARSDSADCTGSITIGQTKTCTITNDDIQPKLIVIKTVVNDNGGTAVASDFSITVTGTEVSPAIFPGAEAPGTEVGLDAGTYSVTESTVAGYAASPSAECSGSINVGETKTCTITNDDIQPKLFVIKTVIIDHGGTAVASDFTISVTGGDVSPASFPGAAAPGTEVGLDAGSYSVNETGPSGYARSDSADCAGSIAIGQTKTCTITNDDIQPKLFVIKAVVNDHGGTATAANFTMTVNGTDVSLASFAGTGAPGTEVGLDAGTFSVGESGPAGYARSDSADCSGTIAVGETKTCTVTNDDIQPKLTVIKTVINDHGGTAASSDFTMTVTGTDVSPGSFPGSASGTTVGLDAGAYTVTEPVLFGYAQSSSIDCSGTIAIGETKTCTVTNDDIQPKLKVIKTVINDNGGTAMASNFTMSVIGTDVSLPSFPGAAGPAGTLVGLDAGSYSVEETTVFGYAGSPSADCTGTINIGETKTCTITNDDIQPQLIVIKHVVNNNGGVSVASSFTMSVTGNSVSPASFPGAEAPGTTVALNAGSFSVGETGPPLYIRSDSGECSGTIGIGQVKTCTVTNNDLYDFRGFFSPVENLPKVNKVNAGRAIPLKWELRDHLGNFVLNLDAVDSIQYVRVGCSVGEVIAPMPLDADDSGTSGLRITDNQFHFNWKTEKSFANTCMELRVTLDDSTVHTAKFNFTK